MKKTVVMFFILVSNMCMFAQATDTTKAKKIVYTEAVSVPNTSVKIWPPAYFAPSDKFNGFYHQGAGASLQITETEGNPYPVMAEALANEENLKKQNIKLISRENVKTKAGKPGVLFVIGFSVKAPNKTFEYERIMLLTGDYNKTIIVNANYPVLAKDILFEVLKQSVLTVEY